MRRAFTLLELLVVLAVVGTLVGLGFPAYRRAVQNARATVCLSNLRQLGGALNLYLADHEMRMPVLEAGRRSKGEEKASIDTVLGTYVKDARVFACPADDGNFARDTGTSYFWNTALNGQPVGALRFLVIEDQSRIPVISDKEGFHPYQANKVNILFADGHATKELNFFTAP